MRFGSLMLATLLAVGGLSAASCTYRNETLNRIVDPYWRKSDFDPNTQWYYRTTTVDVPPASGWISPAEGDWLLLERVKWEVTEQFLFAWRDYPVTPGTELDQQPGAEDTYRGEPVAIFRIVDHFDIRNTFDPGSGEVGNEIVENRDRLWFDRANMRVDWSTNLVSTYKWHIVLNQFFPNQPVVNNNPADPKRWRFEVDANDKLEYFEVTTQTTVEPDIFSLYGYYGPQWSCFGGTCDLSAQQIDMRHSFMRVKPSEYEALPMPGTVVLEDENGEEVRDERGFAVRVPVNDRFAFYGTLGRNTFDENRGMVTSGQIFNASRFNIWETWRNADGSPQPVEQRTPKAIVYYTNVEHPQSLLPASQKVAEQWNRVFRDTVRLAQPGRYSGELDATGIPSDVPPMFVLRENDCNVANVETVLNGLPGDLRTQIEAEATRTAPNPDVVSFNGSIADVRTRVAHANDPANDAPFTARQTEETQALADLERICAALEYYTGPDITLGRGAPTREDGSAIDQFKYQRLGDTRYPLMNVMPHVFESGWSGYGPMYIDPVSGETITATASIAMHHIDRSAARVAQYVSVLNGEVSPLDIAYGFDIERYMNEKLLATNGLTSRRPENRAKEELHSYFDAISARAASGDLGDAIGETPPGRDKAMMERLVGTEIEQLLITPDDLTAFGGQDPIAAEGATLDDELMQAVSPIRGGNMMFKFEEQQKHEHLMGLRAMDPPSMIDNFAIGQAVSLRNLSYEDRFKKLRENIYVAVMLHEVGHNVGLWHNMRGSSDALNYGQTFWDLQALPEDMDGAIDALSNQSDELSQARITNLQDCQRLLDDAATNPNIDPRVLQMTTQECLRQTEVMYSSIMDYHANWNADFGGLGPYDAAAIKFGYAQLIEVFPQDVLAPELQQQIEGLNAFDAENVLERRLFLEDWRDIARTMVRDTDSVQNGRSHVKLDWNTSSMRIPDLDGQLIVPYKWGPGGRQTPDDLPFDFGADFRQNAQWNLLRYYERYFFSHFARQQLLDFYDLVPMAVGADQSVMRDFTSKMQWFFFFSASDPEFRGSYREDDMLQSTVEGLNLLGQVLAHPGNGLHVSVRQQDVFGILDLPPEERNATPTDIAIQWAFLGECTARQVAVTDGAGDGIFQEPQPGFNAGIVPASEGRPFFLGLTDDYEEWYATYVGTYWTKSLALQYLGANYAYLPRVDGDVDPRIYNISWYRLFPKEVSKLMHSVMVDGRSQEIGHRIDPDGNFVQFKLINDDLTTPDYTGMTKVMPSIAFNHQFFAPIWANIYMSSPNDDTLDLAKTMRIALEGGNDDMSAFDEAEARAIADGIDPAEVIATFTHPVTGLTLRGLKIGEFPIAYDLIARANRLKERFDMLDTCLADFQAGTPGADLPDYCDCINAYADPLTGDCREERVENVGEAGCSEYSLRNRRDAARESMDDMVDYINNLRSINAWLGAW